MLKNYPKSPWDFLPRISSRVLPEQRVLLCKLYFLHLSYSNGKQRNHRSTEALSRGNGQAAGSRNTTPGTTRRRLHRSVSREERISWRGWVRLVKPNPGDSYGIGLSEGLSSRGIYVSALRPGSVADASGLLQLYDRIIKVSVFKLKLVL